MAEENFRKPLIIAGPCSVESREQTLATCRALASYGSVDMIRGGVWKPRTSPACFQGVGDTGLEWLAEAAHQTGLPFGVEVANARHVEAALRGGATMLWIGARTTGNPFSVQEVADATGGSGVTVLIKNGQMPDVEIWSGAVERMLRTGIEPDKLLLVHRGFAQTSSVYRNPPLWHIALEMRRRFPYLKMLCDPSHICGKRELVAAIAQRAADLSYDGLFIESHIDPDGALSDSAQQITPSELNILLSGIRWRKEEVSITAFEKEMERLRLEIDQIDSQLFFLLSQRMKIADAIGMIKRDNDVTILQRKRWEELVDNVLGRSGELGLSREFIKAILNAIHMESIAHQNDVMNSVG